MNDTDRELLEAAAKAAGIEYDGEASKPHPKSGAFWGLWLAYDREPHEHERRYWNPLTDDGDALRLAVKLGIGIEWWDSMPDGVAGCVNFDGNGKIMMKNTSERAAILRRAIVRAAAETARAAASTDTKGER